MHDDVVIQDTHNVHRAEDNVTTTNKPTVVINEDQRVGVVMCWIDVKDHASASTALATLGSINSSKLRYVQSCIRALTSAGVAT